MDAQLISIFLNAPVRHLIQPVSDDIALQVSFTLHLSIQAILNLASFFLVCNHPSGGQALSEKYSLSCTKCNSVNEKAPKDFQ